MRWMRCRLTHVSVRGAEYGRVMGHGAVVDVDEVVGFDAHENGESTPVTLADCLGPLLEHFEPATPDEPAILADTPDDEEN